MIMNDAIMGTMGDAIIRIISIIIRAMDNGTPNARAIGVVNVTRIDNMTFHVREKESDKGAASFGVDTTSKLVGNILLTRAWLAGGNALPDLYNWLKADIKTIGIGAGWLPGAREFAIRAVAETLPNEKIEFPPMKDDGSAAARRERTLTESDQHHLLTKLRRAEKAAIEGTISRNAIRKTIDYMEDQIENRYCADEYDFYRGAVEALTAIFGV